jgi:O-antigen/teichoic acid export membrane protein
VGFVRKIGLVGVTNFLIGVGSIIILIIITKNFAIQEYGIWVQVTVTIGLIPYIATLGLSDSMIRFLAVLRDTKKIKEEFYSIVFVAVLFSLFVSFLLFMFSGVIAERLFDGNTVIALILPLIIVVVSLDNLLLSFFRTFQQMKRYSIFMLLQSYILIAIVAYCAFYKYSIVTAIIGILISYVIIFLMLLVLIISNIGFKFPEFKNLREYLSFGLPNIPSNLSLWILDSSDRYLIGILLGTSFVGYYSPSYAIGNIITMFASPLYVILFPVLSKYYDENEKNKVNITLRYTLKYYLAASIPSFFILSLLSKQILQILTTTQIAFEGYLITPFAALSTLLIGICIIISQIILLEKKTKLIGFIWVVAAVLNIGLNIILIPIFGILGAGLVTLISYTVALVSLLHYSRKYLVFDMDLKFILKSVLSSALASTIVIIFYPSTVLTTGIVILSFFAIYVSILIILKGIRRNEIQFFKNLVFN